MKTNLKIIVICVVVFLIFNLIGETVLGSSGQTQIEIVQDYGLYALYGLIFAVILIGVNFVLGRRK